MWFSSSQATYYSQRKSYDVITERNEAGIINLSIVYILLFFSQEEEDGEREGKGDDDDGGDHNAMTQSLDIRAAATDMYTYHHGGGEFRRIYFRPVGSCFENQIS